jgi:hypothetical protein
MSNTLTLLDKTPDWIEAFCREIGTLKFASAFDTFTPDAKTWSLANDHDVYGGAVPAKSHLSMSGHERKHRRSGFILRSPRPVSGNGSFLGFGWRLSGIFC